MSDFEHRVAELEKRTKNYRRMVVSFMLVLCGIFVVGAATDEAGETIQVKSIQFMGDDGKVAIEVDADFLYVVIEQTQRAATAASDRGVTLITPNGTMDIDPDKKAYRTPPTNNRRNLPFEPFVVPAK